MCFILADLYSALHERPMGDSPYLLLLSFDATFQYTINPPTVPHRVLAQCDTLLYLSLARTTVMG